MILNKFAHLHSHVLPRVGRLLPPLQQGQETLLLDHEKEFLFGAKIIVETRKAHPRLTGDIADGGSVKTLLCKNGRRGLENLLESFVVVAS